MNIARKSIGMLTVSLGDFSKSPWHRVPGPPASEALVRDEDIERSDGVCLSDAVGDEHVGADAELAQGAHDGLHGVPCLQPLFGARSEADVALAHAGLGSSLLAVVLGRPEGVPEHGEEFVLV